jgi:hypothetical protein
MLQAWRDRLQALGDAVKQLRNLFKGSLFNQNLCLDQVDEICRLFLDNKNCVDHLK